MPDDAAPAAEAAALPAVPEVERDLALFGGDSLPPSLRVMLDEKASARMAAMANMMAHANGITPAHLIGKPAACHVVINMALDWKMSPHFVARHTYQTPGGQIGFEGALVQGILQQSGRINGAIEFEYTGDFTQLAGKFQMVDGAKGGKYPKALWTDKDAIGLGIRVKAHLRNEAAPRYWPSPTEWFWLVQCQPRNSPLWATDPRTQIAYLAVRRFANQACPELLGGMPFDVDELLDASDRAINVTPVEEVRPQSGQRAPIVEHEDPWKVIRDNGESFESRGAATAVEALSRILRSAQKQALKTLDTAWENNEEFRQRLEQSGYGGDVDALTALYNELRAELHPDQVDAETGEITEGERQPGDDDGEEATTDGSENPPGAEGVTEVSSPQAGTPENGALSPSSSGPTATRTASRSDPFWNRESLKLDPPAAKGGRAGVLDWRVWPALIKPKLAAATTAEQLNRLWADNEPNLALYARYEGERPKDDLLFEFDLARERVTKGG